MIDTSDRLTYLACCEKYLKDNKHNSLHLTLKINKLRYLFLDIICSSKITVFLELRSWETVRFSEQITSADKYLSISIFWSFGIFLLQFAVQCPV